MKPHTLDPPPRLGSCGWSYDQWDGAFYPPKLPPPERLAFYARYLDAVEVDSTFYHAPAAHVVQAWRDETPETFRFACKLPRAITHDARLRSVARETGAFAERMSLLGARLACVLVQLPPWFHPAEGSGDLKQFLAGLPQGVSWALEFRNPAWHTPATIEAMHNAGAAWVWHDTTAADTEEFAAFELQPATGPLLYIRLLGETENHSADCDTPLHTLAGRDAALDVWVPRIAHETAASGRPAWIFASNRYEGFAPETCRRLGRRFGLEISLPTAHDRGIGGGEDQIELL